MLLGPRLELHGDWCVCGTHVFGTLQVAPLLPDFLRLPRDIDRPAFERRDDRLIAERFRRCHPHCRAAWGLARRAAAV